MTLYGRVDELIAKYPALACVHGSIISAYKLLLEAYVSGCKTLIAGNGGSAADAEHIVGELMKSFKRKRECNNDLRKALTSIDADLGIYIADHLQGALPTISLCEQIALSTAYMNDCEPQLCFAQQVYGYGKTGDVFWGISTSGNSPNVVYAAIVAKAVGMKVIAMTGERDSKLSAIADVCIRAPGTETYSIQEYHVPIYHCLCLMLEDQFFSDD